MHAGLRRGGDPAMGKDVRQQAMPSWCCGDPTEGYLGLMEDGRRRCASISCQGGGLVVFPTGAWGSAGWEGKRKGRD